MKPRNLAPMLWSWALAALCFAAGWGAARWWQAPAPPARVSPGVSPPTAALGAPGLSPHALSAPGLGPSAVGAPGEVTGSDEARPPLDEVAFSQCDQHTFVDLDENVQALTRPDRLAVLPPAEVAAELGARPGMTVVDVGAGAGSYTFAFAAALAGQGQVFATEVDAPVLQHLRAQARERALPNVTAVPVRPEGLDDFYRQHVFDLVFLSSVFEFLPDPVAFFSALRPSLRPESGRLAIVQGVPVQVFHPFHFAEAFRHARLGAEGPSFPVWRRLPPALQRAVQALGPEEALPAEHRAAMVAAFEAMLVDPALFWEVNRHHNARVGVASELMRHLAPDDARLAQWLVLHYDGEGIFRRAWETLREDEREALRTLNMLTLTPYFDTRKLGATFSSACVLYLHNRALAGRMRRAGYRLERVSTRFKGHALLVFRVDPDA